MTKPNSHTLLSKLKSSLPKLQNLKSAPLDSLSVPSETVIERKYPRPTSEPAKVGEPVDPRAQKLSVCLYRTDLAKLDEIKEFMRKEGYRNLSDSAALQLACRAVKITDEFLDCYQQIQKEDGRRRGTEK